MTVFCSRCGQQFAPSDRFCGSCGTPVVSVGTETLGNKGHTSRTRAVLVIGGVIGLVGIASMFGGTEAGILGSGQGGDSPATEGASPTTSPTSQGSRTTDDDPSGIVYVTCSDRTAHLAPTVIRIIDPSDGSISSDATVEEGRCSQMPDMSTLVELRLEFDDDFSRQTHDWRPRDDDSARVGWLDVHTGRLVDVSELDSTDSFSGAPHDTDPRFDPATGDFYFVNRDAELRKVSGDNPTSSARMTPPDEVLTGRSGIGTRNWHPIWLMAVDLQQFTERTLVGERLRYSLEISPDGQRALEVDQVVVPGASHWHHQFKVFRPNGSMILDTGPIRIDSESSIQYFSWDGGDKVYFHGQYALGTRLFSVSLQQGTHRSLVPETSKRVWSPLPSPDGSQVAFLSQEGEQTELWIVSSSGGTPRKVANLGEIPSSSDGVLLDWLP